MAIIQNSFKNATTEVRSLVDEANDGNMQEMAELVAILERDPDSHPANH